MNSDCRQHYALNTSGKEAINLGSMSAFGPSLMGWMPPPDGIEVCHAGDVALPARGEGIHGEGYDHWDRLGKASVPSPCGVEGRPVLRKKVSRPQLLGFLAKQPPAMVAMESCATAHEWGRAISGLGHDVRLVPRAALSAAKLVRLRRRLAVDR